MADSSIARLEAQVEIKADVEKYYGFFRNNLHRLVQMFPKNIRSFQIQEGDEVRAGCLTHWKYDLAYFGALVAALCGNLSCSGVAVVAALCGSLSCSGVVVDAAPSCL
nr:mlp-like protein 43 [Quercus suber]